MVEEKRALVAGARVLLPVMDRMRDEVTNYLLSTTDYIAILRPLDLFFSFLLLLFLLLLLQVLLEGERKSVVELLQLQARAGEEIKAPAGTAGGGGGEDEKEDDWLSR